MADAAAEIPGEKLEENPEGPEIKVISQEDNVREEVFVNNYS